MTSRDRSRAASDSSGDARSTPTPPLDDRLRRLWRSAVDSGEPFPGEPALALRLGASRPALREALIRLEHEGLIGKRKGAETTVNRAAIEIPARFDQQIEKADLIRA